MKSTQQAEAFIQEEIIPMVKLKDTRAVSALLDDLEALVIALTSGNQTLVMAMASYISRLDGLENGAEIARRIFSEI